MVLSSRIGNRRVHEESPLYEKTTFIYHSDTGNGGHFDTKTKVNGMMCKQYYYSHCDKGTKDSNLEQDTCVKIGVISVVEVNAKH